MTHHPVKVETVREHDNEYGDQVHKVIGDKYSLPHDAFKQLEAQGLVKKVAEEKPGKPA